MVNKNLGGKNTIYDRLFGLQRETNDTMIFFPETFNTLNAVCALFSFLPSLDCEKSGQDLDFSIGSLCCIFVIDLQFVDRFLCLVQFMASRRKKNWLTVSDNEL